MKETLLKMFLDVFGRIKKTNVDPYVIIRFLKP